MFDKMQRPGFAPARTEDPNPSPIRPTGPSTMFWPAALGGMAPQLEPRVHFVVPVNNIYA